MFHCYSIHCLWWRCTETTKKSSCNNARLNFSYYALGVTSGNGQVAWIYLTSHDTLLTWNLWLGRGFYASSSQSINGWLPLPHIDLFFFQISILSRLKRISTSMKYCRAIHSPPQAKTYKKLGLKPVTSTLASRPQFFYATPRLLKLYLCAKFEVAAWNSL